MEYQIGQPLPGHAPARAQRPNSKRISRPRVTPPADALLEGLDRQKVAELIGQAEFGAMVDLAVAEIALARGDRATAQRAFTAANITLHAMTDATTRNRLAALRRALAG